MKKVIIASTDPMTLAIILKGLPKYLTQFFHVQLVTAPGPDVERIRANEGVAVECINMTRRVTPMADLTALFRLCSYFARERPDIVHSYTPKAGLLCMMAAAAVRVPHRVHSILGMPLMGARGVTRAILSVTERVTYLFSTHLLCTGPGLRDYVRPRLTRKPIHVIADGGVGVDMAWFRNDFDADARQRVRSELNLAPEDFVLMYSGRFLPDKGLVELVDAVVDVHQGHPTVRLLLVGMFDETRETLPRRTRVLIDSHPAIRNQGWTWDVRPSLVAADAFVLASYREGLSTCLIEACAFDLPCIATNIIGCREIISDGVNGLLVPARDSDALARAIQNLLDDWKTYRALRANARKSVELKYSKQRYHEGLKDEYLKLLGEPARLSVVP